MHHPFNNQVTLITGAGSGIGRQLALEMARRGAIIAAIDVHEEALTSLVTELKAENLAGAWQVADVTELAQLQEAVASFEKRLGPIEIMIANAGIGFGMSALDFHAEDLERQVAVNLLGVAKSIEAILPRMLKRGCGQLVAISSLGSYRGLPHMAGYCASKSGVNALMESLRLELRPRGIACTTICPGWVRTPLSDVAAREAARALGGIPVPKVGMLEVADAARRIVRVIERRRPFDAFPMHWRLLSAFLHWLPARLSDRLVRTFLRWFSKRGPR